MSFMSQSLINPEGNQATTVNKKKKILKRASPHRPADPVGQPLSPGLSITNDSKVQGTLDPNREEG